jgi:hypothetical protein
MLNSRLNLRPRSDYHGPLIDRVLNQKSSIIWGRTDSENAQVGAEKVDQIRSLIATCVLHDIDPYTFLVDVLQRIDTHPHSKV